MNAFYELKTAGASPVSLTDMKTYLKKGTTADDALIASLITAATEYGEKYTGREFRANVWTLFLDGFPDRITLRRSPVDVVDSVKYLKATTLTTVGATVYFLKNKTQVSEIVLQEDQEWPTDIDNREQSVEVEFTTKIYARCAQGIAVAIKAQVAYMYFNRGDCPDIRGATQSGSKSGADAIYDTFRISRV